jgi:hypothetical protein
MPKGRQGMEKGRDWRSEGGRKLRKEGKMGKS